MRKSRILNPGYIYVLALEESRYYIGETGDLKRRLREHLTGLYYDMKKRRWVPGGSVVTRRYKPLRLCGLYRPDMNFRGFQELVAESDDLSKLESLLRKERTATETDIAVQYMKIYGQTHVRGARWCSIEKPPKMETIEKVEESRPLCKCGIPTERIVPNSGKDKWVCGCHLIHDLFGAELYPSTRGLLLPLGDHLSISVSLTCEMESKRFLPENKEAPE